MELKNPDEYCAVHPNLHVSESQAADLPQPGPGGQTSVFTQSHPNFSRFWAICGQRQFAIWHLGKTGWDKTQLWFWHKGPTHTKSKHPYKTGAFFIIFTIFGPSLHSNYKTGGLLTSSQPQNLCLLRRPLMQRGASRGSLSRAQTGSQVPAWLPQRNPPFQWLLWHLQLLLWIPVSHTARLGSLLRSGQGGKINLSS